MKWTDKKKEYLESNYGTMDINKLAKKLGTNLRGIRIKAERLGIGSAIKNSDVLNANDLASSLGVNHHVVTRYINNHGLKAEFKNVTGNRCIWRIEIKDFWKWAEQHKELIDFRKWEFGTLGVEPKWMAECRKEKRDLKKGTLWSEYEDKVLVALWNSGTSTQVIADRLGRTHSGVRRRAKNLRLKNKTFGTEWTDRETKMLIKLYNKDMESKDIAIKLNRSKHQVEGKKHRLRENGTIITPYKHHGGVKKASNAIVRKMIQNTTTEQIRG